MSARKAARKPKATPKPAAETIPSTERDHPAVKSQEHYSAEGDLDLAIGKIEAAAWLMDQIEIGELGFLTAKPGGKAYKVPCWLSVVEGDADNLAATLEHWAIETIAREVQVIRRAVKVLCPEAEVA
jgi:hypothetical protein